jgi:hypothetical protein
MDLIQLIRLFGNDNYWNKRWNKPRNPLLELSYGNLRGWKTTKQSATKQN